MTEKYEGHTQVSALGKGMTILTKFTHVKVGMYALLHVYFSRSFCFFNDKINIIQIIVDSVFTGPILAQMKKIGQKKKR